MLRNAARPNLMLGLMRLDLNGVTDERRYRSIIRQNLFVRSGQPTRQLSIAYPKGHDSLRA